MKFNCHSLRPAIPLFPFRFSLNGGSARTRTTLLRHSFVASLISTYFWPTNEWTKEAALHCQDRRYRTKRSFIVSVWPTHQAGIRSYSGRVIQTFMKHLKSLWRWMATCTIGARDRCLDGRSSDTDHTILCPMPRRM